MSISLIPKTEANSETMPVFGTEDDLPTQTYKDYFEDIYAKFFGAESIVGYVKSPRACYHMSRKYPGFLSV
jgi:hypothetical protein